MDSFYLKILACVLMLIDHSAIVYFHDNVFLRIIGRLSFPLFAYLLAINFNRTSDKRNYFIRLLAFAFISQIPFQLLFNLHTLNIFFTLCFGFSACYFWSNINRSFKSLKNWFNILCFLLVLFFSFTPIDYSIYGVLVILFFYIFKTNLKKQFLSLLFLNILFYNIMPLQFFSILAFIPLYFYNNNKGISLKYAFYSFYPVHLFLLLLFKHL